MPADVSAMFDSPIGELGVQVDAAGALHGIVFADRTEVRVTGENATRCEAVVRQLGEYFGGVRREFSLPLHLDCGTPFQRAVWTTLIQVPFGETITYRQLAERVGRPAAIRAAGAANGANPIPIVIPCHRVIGTDGALTGYGGGLERKLALLRLERVPQFSAERLVSGSQRRR